MSGLKDTFELQDRFIVDIGDDLQLYGTILDFCFLSGYLQPTLAVLQETGLLPIGHCAAVRNTCTITVFAVDILSKSLEIVWQQSQLPHDSLRLQTLSSNSLKYSLALITMNAILLVNSNEIVGIATNGFATISVGLFYIVNLLGLKTSSRTQNILMIVKISLIVLLISSVFKGQKVPIHDIVHRDINVYNGNNGWMLLLVSLVAVFFTYGGYQQTINFGSEIKSAKTMQRGIVLGIVIVLFLYLTVNYAYINVIGFDEMKKANAIGSLLFEAWFGKYGAKAFDFAMVLSVLAYVNVVLMSNPRVMFAMSEDKVLPKMFQSKNAKTGALIPGLTVFALITIITILLSYFAKDANEIDDLLSFSIFLDCIGMSTSAATLFILRKRGQGDASVTGALKKWTPILAAIFVLAYAFVAVAVVIDKPYAALTALCLIIIVLIVYRKFYYKPQPKIA
jgi:APA family basic amino acid/polyamine antiporter